MADERTGKLVEIKVWDLAVRIFHWLLVLCILGSVISVENDFMDAHEIFGVTALVLVLFRVIWGFVGGEFARFRSFVRGPAASLAYLRGLRRGDLPPTIGHNPPGGWSVLALLAVIGGQAALGLFANDDVLFDGPLTRFVSDDVSDRATVLHGLLSKVLFGLIALHLLAIAAYRFVFSRHLTRPMITGTTWIAADAVPQRLRHGHPLAAMLVLLLSAACILWLVYGT